MSPGWSVAAVQSARSRLLGVEHDGVHGKRTTFGTWRKPALAAPFPRDACIPCGSVFFVVVVVGPFPLPAATGD